MENRIALIFLTATLVMFFAEAVSAEVEVTFSHKNTPHGTITQVPSVANGEKIKVTVIDTDTSKFECEVTGIELAGDRRAAANACRNH